LGLEIDREEFSDEDYARFATRLDACLAALAQLLARPGFGAGEPSIGAELEASLVDAAAAPLPLNRAVLAETVDPRLTVELDRFNLEANLRHGPLAGRPFAALARECRGALAEMARASGLHGGRVVTIGILPTLAPAALEATAMTESTRYRALSASLRRLRREPFLLDIHGAEDLRLRCHDVTYEGAATSFQLHLRSTPGAFVRTYNAIQLATPLVLAVSGNSPIFLGRQLWEETRIALFKQAVDHRSEHGPGRPPARVSFGERWIGDVFEPFEEAVRRHPVLLPVLDVEDPQAALAAGRVPALRELRLHQGTVWRWNRAIYDPAGGGHLRIEMRALPAGPSVPDMLANAAFHVGLGLALAPDADAWCAAVPFDEVHRSFYRAAREGLLAELIWPGAPGAEPAIRPVRELLETLLPLAQQGLDRAGVERCDSEPLLATIERRARSGRTGAAWQRRALAAGEASGRSREEALAWMLERYLEASASGEPVDRWPDPPS
jgi:gamma-glutamyl:cysteine ligase YbdK (ATP-grasp superfamily)